MRVEESLLNLGDLSIGQFWAVFLCGVDGVGDLLQGADNFFALDILAPLVVGTLLLQGQVEEAWVEHWFVALVEVVDAPTVRLQTKEATVLILFAPNLLQLGVRFGRKLVKCDEVWIGVVDADADVVTRRIDLRLDRQVALPLCDPTVFGLRLKVFRFFCPSLDLRARFPLKSLLEHLFFHKLIQFARKHFWLLLQELLPDFLPPLGKFVLHQSNNRCLRLFAIVAEIWLISILPILFVV